MKKTPREILFERHRDMEGRLDAIRERVLVQELTIAGTRTARACRDVVRLLARLPVRIWMELFWPCCRVWAGFAFVWLVIISVNLADSDDSIITRERPTLAPGETFMAWEQRHRLLVELIGPAETHEADKPRPVAPKPRSERRLAVSMT